MKSLILLLSILVGSASYAQPMKITVQVPKDAKEIKLTAENVMVDTCNSFGLNIYEGFGAIEGYSVGVVGTELPCTTDGFKYITLSGTVQIVEKKSEAIFNFDTHSFTDLKIEFN